VGYNVVKLSGGLVVPGAPRLPGVDRDGGSLIASQKNNRGIVGIDPHGVVIIAARSALEGGKRLAAVSRSVHRRVGDIDDVSVFGINLDLGKIAAASPEPGLAIDTTPVFAGVVRAVDPALLRRIHQGIEPPRVRGDDAD